MTIAVCLKCGGIKHGAWALCPECEFIPDDDESMTQHLLVTDRFNTQEELAHIAERIKSGEGITFDPETLKEAWVNADDIRRQNQRMKVGCMVFFMVLILAVVSTIIFFFF